jgi:hypothetical protein
VGKKLIRSHISSEIGLWQLVYLYLLTIELILVLSRHGAVRTSFLAEAAVPSPGEAEGNVALLKGRWWWGIPIARVYLLVISTAT